ncbi:MAG: Mechanosensitive channel MscK precursor [Syntrophorhabdus sp. PtaU1.Bin153]|nr:MAG: Mechanosensitive channel MscK precursor [Syntrophorhabdus sp. PtaU1.Bin153]
MFAMLGWIIFNFAPVPAKAQKTKQELPWYVSVAINPERIREKIKEVESDKGLEENTKSKLLTFYRQAASSLDLVASYEAYSTSFSQSITAAAAEEARVSRLIRDMDRKTGVAPKTDLSRLPSGDLEKRYVILQAELTSLREEYTALEESLQEQRTRPSRIKEELSAARKTLQGIDGELRSLQLSKENPLVIEARQTALQARKKEGLKQIAMLNRELASYGPRIQLLSAERDLALRKLNQAQAKSQPFEDEIKRRLDAESEKSKASVSGRNGADGGHPVLQKIMKENTRLGQEAASVTEGMKEAALARDACQERLKQIEQDFADAQQKVRVAGFSKSLGHVLLEQLRNLPDTKSYEKDTKRLEERIGDIWLANISVDESQRRLSDVEQEVRRTMTEEVKERLDPTAKADIEGQIRDLLKEQKTLLGKLSDAYLTYLSTLGDLEITQKHLITTNKDYRRFLESRVLWIPNAPPLKGRMFRESLKTSWSTLLRASWADIPKALLADIRKWPVPWLLFLALFAPVFRKRRSIRIMVAEIGDRASNPLSDRFFLTVQALVLTTLMALPEPLVSGFLGWRLQEALEVSDFARVVGKALWVLAILLFYLRFLYLLCIRKGLGEVHFWWSRDAVRVLRKELAWYLAISLPLTFVLVILWFVPGMEQGRGERLVFIAAMLAMSLVILRLMRPSGGLFKRHDGEEPRGFVYRFRYVWYPLLAAIPVSLAGLAAAGYMYTAGQLTDSLFRSFWLITGAVIAHDLVARWVAVANRRAVLGEFPAGAEGHVGINERDLPGSPERTRLLTLSVQTRKLLHAVIGMGMLVGFLIIWSEIFPAISALDQVVLWQHTVSMGGKEIQQPITLSNVAIVLILAIVTVVFVRNIPGLLEVALLQYLPVSGGTRYAATSLTRYTIVVAGIIGMFHSLGGTWSQIQWLVAALGVGLGFGLQEIFGNLISGIIILFERPIRVGDTITVGDVSGTVTAIRMRATTIRDFDNKELIIPNKTFITGQLINWTLTDPITRVTFKVGVAYGSDLKLAHQVVLDTVKSNHLVLENPEPQVYILGFGESSIDFSVNVFARRLADRLPLSHELHMAIEEVLRDNGIIIPFPQREVYLHSFKDSSPVAQSATESKHD